MGEDDDEDLYHLEAHFLRLGGYDTLTEPDGDVFRFGSCAVRGAERALTDEVGSNAMSIAMSADLPDSVAGRTQMRQNAMADGRLVHVVDDEDSIRRSLDFLLRTTGFEVEKWADGESFLRGADRSAPACVLLDVRMPGLDGLQVQAEMADRGLNLAVIVLTGHGDISTAVRAMQAGAVDFIEKPFSRDRLLDALEAGFMRLADREALREREQWAKTQVAGLTQREQDVLEGLACGYPNKTIAYDLGISSRTVEVYRANAMLKLDVTNFADALRIAFTAGMGSQAEWRRRYAVGMPRDEGSASTGE